MTHKKQVVIFSGGNGSAEILQALKSFSEDIQISAIVTVADSGGSSGRLRAEFQTLPPGDILRAVLALSSWDYETVLKPIFYGNRFVGEGKLSGHNLGNLFLTLSAQYSGDLMSAIRALEMAVQSVGKVYPTTLDNVQLVGQLENGEKMVGEHNLDRPASSDSKIDRVWLEPNATFLPEAAEVVKTADVIFFGPGSLFTSVIPSILPDGAQEAIAASSAQLVYVAGNKFETNGEVGPERLSDFVKILEEYLPRPIDMVIFNKFNPNPEQRDFYQQKDLSLVDFDSENLGDKKIIVEPFERITGGTDPVQLSVILKKFIN